MLPSRALALGPDSAQVHSSAALIRNAEWDWTGAERELRRALQVNPGYAPTYQRLALTATVHGRFDEAQSLLRRAQTFDPLNWMVTYALGENAYYARRFDEAIVFAGQLDVKGATANLLHRAWFQKHDLARSRAALAGDHTTFAEIDRITLTPDHDAAARALRNLLSETHERLAPCFVASSAARIGLTDVAFEWLEKAYAAHDPDLASLGIEPDFDSIRGDPRYRGLLRRVGL